MPRIERSKAGWRIVSDDGVVLRDNLTNAQAWRNLDNLTQEPQAPRDVAKDFVVAVADHETRQQWYSALLKLAYDKGRKRGWAAHVFRDKFGDWPDDMKDDCGPMFPAVSMFLRDRRK